MMIKKFVLTLLNGLFWTPYAFAMIEPVDIDEPSAKTRHQHAPAPIIKPENLTESMRKNQLVLFMLERKFEEAQFYCLDKSNTTTGLVSKLFWEANVICSNDDSIQSKFPAHLQKLAPYLEADVLQDRPTHVEQAIQEEDPLTKLQNHPLIIAIQQKDYDAAQSYCDERANKAKSAQNLEVHTSFKEGVDVFSRSGDAILNALPELLKKLAPHLMNDSAHPDPTPLHPRFTYNTTNFEQFTKRLEDETASLMGKKAEFPRRLAREINANFFMTTNEATSS